MKIVIALDSFKGSCSAQAACAAVAEGLQRVSTELELVQLPVSDGGEGLLSCLAHSPQLADVRQQVCQCYAPYGQTVSASYLLAGGDTAIVEMAQCCGLELTARAQRDVRKASSYGLGQVFRAVLDQGVSRIIVGLGGSGTNDGGLGFLQALGVRFFDAQNQLINAPGSGEDLARVARVDDQALDARLRDISIDVSCDVRNPLLGQQGASWVYGRQKGADDAALAELEAGMSHYSQIISQLTGRHISHMPGAGAAGGMGAALLWFSNARLKAGISLVLELLGAPQHLSGADLVFVGEGWLDQQSAFGKAPVGVAEMAAGYQVPVIALCGGRDSSSHVLYQHHVSAMWSICPRPMTLAESVANCAALLADAAENALRTFIAGRGRGISQAARKKG